MDLLVRLYDLPKPPRAPKSIEIRRSLPPERRMIVGWIEREFGSRWAGECETALTALPPGMFLAVKGGRLLGFACYDATAKGFFGPTGVDAKARGRGVGTALLFRTLAAMREAGYAYAVIGSAAKALRFYAKTVGATPIAGSNPGLYKGMLK